MRQGSSTADASWFVQAVHTQTARCARGTSKLWPLCLCPMLAVSQCKSSHLSSATHPPSSVLLGKTLPVKAPASRCRLTSSRSSPFVRSGVRFLLTGCTLCRHMHQPGQMCCLVRHRLVQLMSVLRNSYACPVDSQRYQGLPSLASAAYCSPGVAVILPEQQLHNSTRAFTPMPFSAFWRPKKPLFSIIVLESLVV